MSATDYADHAIALGPDLDLDGDTAPAWTIDNDDLAGWALRKIAKATDERDRIRQAAAAEIARIQAWAEDAERGPNRDIAFFESKLIDYRRRLEADDPKLGLYKLPAGSIGRRKGSESVVVESEEEFLSWALDNDHRLLRVSVDKSAVKRLDRTEDGVVVTADGERVPGVSVQRGEDRYEVRPAAPSAVSDLDPF